MEYWIEQLIKESLPDETRDYLHWIYDQNFMPDVCEWLENLEFEILSSYRKNYRYHLQFLQPAYARIKAQMESTGDFTQRLISLPKVSANGFERESEPKEDASLFIGYLLRKSRGKYEVSFSVNYTPQYNYETRQVVIEESETITLINASGLSIEVSDIDEDTEFIDVIMIQSKQSEGFYKVKKQVIEWFDVFMGFRESLLGMQSLVLVDVPQLGELNPEYKTDKNSWRFKLCSNGDTRLLKYWRLMGFDITETEEGWPKATMFRVG